MNEINNRRSIRKFQPIKIPKENILNLLEAARQAPSGHNNQPWYYVVLENEKKDKLADELSKDQTRRSLIATVNAIKQAPILMLVFNKEKDDFYAHQSIGASIQNILLEAEKMNLGTLWIGYVTEISKYIQNINENELIAAIAIGQKDEEPKQRPRKSLEEIYEWYN